LADSRPPVAANAVAVALLVALIAGLLLWQRPWGGDSRRPPDPVPPHANVLLERQFDALTEAGSAAAFVKAAGSSAAAKRFARDVWLARRDLGITGVRMDYTRGGTAADRADGSTSARVMVRWAASAGSPWGASERTEVPVRFRLRPHGGAFDVVSATSEGKEPLPPWLAGQVTLDRFGQSSVVTIDGGADKVDAGPMARRALAKVRALWPQASGRLCVIVPPSPGVAAALLGNTRAGVRQLAAVTTSIDESADAAAVIVNPGQWATMDPQAQQVVMTHEAVHALTGTVGRDVNRLVAEGFADYVALYGDTRPLAVTAGQVLRQVEVSGPPQRLPDAGHFEESTEGLGAVYESAWMLFRMLGDEFGKASVLGLYQLVLDGVSFPAATQEALGLTVDEVTDRWRAYLTKSASTVS
jgi:hypothetical protein